MMTLDTPHNESPRTADDDTRAEECAKNDLTKIRVQLAIGKDPREAGTPVVNREFTLPELAERLTMHERRAGGSLGCTFARPWRGASGPGRTPKPGNCSRSISMARPDPHLTRD